MNIREKHENIEKNILSDYATLSAKTKGRVFVEEKCSVRTDFQRDRDRIIHSEAFKALKGKTQVFIASDKDNYVTRLTHTLQVAQIARSIAVALDLNETLTEAIALGHDVGHPPFGHAAERVLDELCPSGFDHAIQGLRVVEKLEKNGKGLNLTHEVKDGIVNHSLSKNPSTLEGKVVRLADKIAYLSHDIDDSINVGILKIEEIPADIVEYLGEKPSERINKFVTDIINTSEGKNDILMSEECEKYFYALRKYMYKEVYPRVNHNDEKVMNIIRHLYEYYKGNANSKFKEYEDEDRAICDHIASMTDKEAMVEFKNVYLVDLIL
ncbi:MAG: deoxyguanosinetriphosphate triphosphohydrolase [Clostridia bacterium]|jgi:dGTPase|nr:deoxyguanosinetriphosphate triphosphohydrolase [Clostridia bacterium]